MIAIKNATIYPIVKKPFRGSILINRDKIADVGENISIPKEAEIIDAEGKLIFPGFIDSHTHIGLLTEGKGYDWNESINPITPECRAIDAINFLDPSFKHIRSGGVTTVVTGPGSANVIGGQFSLIKTYGNSVEEMIVNPYIGLKMATGENPIKVYQDDKIKTRMGVIATLRKTLTKTKNYMKKWDSYKKNLDMWNNLTDREKTTKPFPIEPDKDLQLDTIASVLRKEVPARVHAHRADDILTAVRIAEEFDYNIIIEHCTEGWKIADEFAKKNIPAIIGPHLIPRTKWETKDLTMKNAIILSEAGVKVCLQMDSFRMTKYLALNAGIIVSHGWKEEEALKSITINPAEVLGVSDRLGSIEKGKDADMSIFNGHPFDSRSYCEKTFIGGKVVWDKDKDDEIIS